MFLSAILVSRRSPYRLYTSSHLSRCLFFPAQLMQSQTITKSTLGIRRSLLDKPLERSASVLILSGLKVRPADLAPHFALTVFGVATHCGIKMAYRLSKPAFLSRNAPQLVVSISLFWINLDRSLETGLCFLTLSSLLINQSEIVMSRVIRLIQSCCLQVPFEVFPSSLRTDHSPKQVS